MNYELIVAMSKNGVIGNNNKLPMIENKLFYDFTRIT